MVTSSKKKWTQNNTITNDVVKQLSDELEASELFIQVCLERGLTSAEEIQKFISIDESWFNDPFLMYDMEKSIERIVRALENNEKITVYGDYDADGMTSTALLMETLDSLGANVDYFLPNRFIEGYGPNITAFENIIEEGTTLIITVDNGVSGHEAIDFAQTEGVDVIVTDHHEIPEQLPNAYAIIHPKHPNGDYPFHDLAGVGVALKVAHALIGELPVDLLDLAAIGTVADLVSLTGENRAIAYFGLKVLENTQRSGLLQLLNVIGKALHEVDEETIGFQIAPRLNAVGRLGEAAPCVELLTTHDPDLAKELAEFVNSQNEERKAIVNDMTGDVLRKLSQLGNDNEVVVLADENWHQGVLGIVASRIVEETNKATLLFTIDSDTGIAKGSARSVNNLNLYQAFTEIESLFVEFGGHHMAAGMSAEVEQVPEIRKALSKYVENLDLIESYQDIDAYGTLEDLSIETIKELDHLRPFGTDNRKPIIACKKVNVVEKRKIGAEGDHLKLLVDQDDTQLDIISFQNGKISDILYEQQEIDVAGYAEINEWNGFTKPQMQMIDLNISGPVLIDKRVSQLKKSYFTEENVDYVYYNKQIFEQTSNLIPTSSNAVLLLTESETKDYVAKQDVIIVDCPPEVESFTNTIENNSSSSFHCYFFKKDHYYLSGLPSRSDFAKVYKYFKTHKNIDLKNEGNLLIKQLKMDSTRVFLIVRVFLEAKFVIINDGLLNAVENPEKMDIQETTAYKNAQKQMQAEELFLYSSFKEIINSVDLVN